MMKYINYWSPIIFFQPLVQAHSFNSVRNNYYADLSNCNYPTLLCNTFVTCLIGCVVSKNCSALIFDTSLSKGNCCLLPSATSLSVWQGTSTIYHKESIKLIQKVYSNPCGSPWNAPARWNMDGPVTHMDFTNTDCIQTFNGANVVSFFSVITSYEKHISLECPGGHKDKHHGKNMGGGVKKTWGWGRVQRKNM